MHVYLNAQPDHQLGMAEALTHPAKRTIPLQNFESIDASHAVADDNGALPGNMVGNLVKRSLGKHNYNTNWKRRYFVMDRTSITYYNDSSLKSLKKPKVLCFLWNLYS